MIGSSRLAASVRSWRAPVCSRFSMCSLLCCSWLQPGASWLFLGLARSAPASELEYLDAFQTLLLARGFLFRALRKCDFSVTCPSLTVLFTSVCMCTHVCSALLYTLITNGQQAQSSKILDDWPTCIAPGGLSALTLAQSTVTPGCVRAEHVGSGSDCGSLDCSRGLGFMMCRIPTATLFF